MSESSGLIIPDNKLIVDKPLSLFQLKEAHNIVSDIIENLDELAIKELMSGYAKDVDSVMEVLLDEAKGIVSAQNKLFNPGSLGYLDKFTESVEETLRSRSLAYFILSVLPEFTVGWFHLQWCSLVQIYRLLNILCARDHGKSYFFSFAYPLWMMYKYKKRGTNRNPTPIELQLGREGMLITNEISLANKFMQMIKDEIEANPILNKVLMPESKSDGSWAKEMIQCKNGSSLITRSFGSQMRGYHPTFIILDDYLNESSLYSLDQREKYLEKFIGSIYPALSAKPKGQMIITGTPYSQHDMYNYLREKNVFKQFIYPGIYSDGKLLFPERHSYKSLMAKKQLLGELVFSREILVQPVSDGATLFKMEILKNSIKGQENVCLVPNIASCSKEFIKVVIGCDFAVSSSIGADYSVFIALGYDAFGVFHLLNMWRKKGYNFKQQMDGLRKMNKDFAPNLMQVETNGFQKVFEEMMGDEKMPVRGRNTNADNKKSLYVGVPAMAVLFEQGRIKLPYGDDQSKAVSNLIMSELNSITFIQKNGKLESVGQHDDTAMALHQAICCIKDTTNDFDFSFLD